MRPRFKKGDIAVYDDRDFYSFIVEKVTYDIDEKEYEYHDENETYYNDCHLFTPTQGLNEAKKYRTNIRREIATLREEEEKISKAISQLEELIEMKRKQNKVKK